METSNHLPGNFLCFEKDVVFPLKCYFKRKCVILRLICPLCNTLKAGGGHSVRIMEPLMRLFGGKVSYVKL